MYQILKSRDASFCSFLLSTRCGTLYFERLLKICKIGIRRFANPAGLPCASRLRLRCSRTSLCDVKSLHVLRSFSEGGWVYQILALLKAISRGFFMPFLGKKAVFPGIGKFLERCCGKSLKYHRVPFERFQIYLDGSPLLRKLLEYIYRNKFLFILCHENQFLKVFLWL